MDLADDASIAVIQQPPSELPQAAVRPWQNVKRTTEFWARAAGVYAAYKVVQVNVHARSISHSCHHVHARNELI